MGNNPCVPGGRVSNNDDATLDGDVPDDAPVLTVSEFISNVNKILAGEFPEGVWIEGEVQGYRPGPQHQYFSLAEKGKANAQLSCALFAFRWKSVKAKLDRSGVVFKDGLKVRLFGTPDIYAPSGRFSFKVADVDTRFALGDIALKRDELLRKLRKSGAIERNKRRDVPLVPLRLGVVSSSSAAGWADAREHLLESGYSFRVTFCPVPVQGDGAAAEIAAAVRTLGARDDIDVIMVMRGGGSKGDLEQFDDEQLALAIANCRLPVFTGIGHEIDRSIADEVAHTACRTPTACADEVIEIVAAFAADLERLGRRVVVGTELAVERSRSRLAKATERIKHGPPSIVERQRSRIEGLRQQVRLLDPATTMARGWSITRAADGTVVTSVGQVAPGTDVVTHVADGSFTSTVSATAPTKDSTKGRT